MKLYAGGVANLLSSFYQQVSWEECSQHKHFQLLFQPHLARLRAESLAFTESCSAALKKSLLCHPGSLILAWSAVFGQACFDTDCACSKTFTLFASSTQLSVSRPSQHQHPSESMSNCMTTHCLKWIGYQRWTSSLHAGAQLVRGRLWQVDNPWGKVFLFRAWTTSQ